MSLAPTVPASPEAEDAGLASWAHRGAVSQALSERLMGRLAFAQAVRTLARGMLDIAAADPRVDGVFKDAGRYVAALLAIYLDMQGGLTLPRLKAFCAQSGFISPSRARALLLYLCFLRYVESVPRGAERGPQRYAPTPSFRAAWMVQSRAALGAAAEIEPAAGRVAQALERPEVFEAFARAHTELLIGSAPDVDQDDAFIRTLMHRNAGSHLIWLLCLAEGPTFPSRTPVVIPTAAAARRFGVSRIHIRRLLDGAVEAGVLARMDGGGIAFSEAAHGRVRLAMAQQLVAILGAAAAALPIVDGAALP